MDAVSGRLEGFYSGPERTISAREAAALRPARKNAPRAKAKPVLREVTSGIVCFCGERYGEGQSLEFMLHLRAEVGADLAIVERQRAYDRVYRQTPEARAAHAARQMRRNRRLGAKPVAEEYARRRAMVPEDDIARLYEAGLGFERIVAELHTSKRSIYRVLRERGIAVRSPGSNATTFRRGWDARRHPPRR